MKDGVVVVPAQYRWRSFRRRPVARDTFEDQLQGIIGLCQLPLSFGNFCPGTFDLPRACSSASTFVLPVTSCCSTKA